MGGRGRERTKINKIRNEKEVTIDITEIQRITRDYYNNYTPEKQKTQKGEINFWIGTTFQD